jgi:hypothetical protein
MSWQVLKNDNTDFTTQTNIAYAWYNGANAVIMSATRAGAWTFPLIHNITTGNLNSGRYTPTLTGVANIASVGTPSSSMYSRVGNIVTVSIALSAQTATASATLTRFRFTLPIASNFTVLTDACGSGSTIRATATVSSNSGICVADATNDQIEFYYVSATTSAVDVYITCQYEVK